MRHGLELALAVVVIGVCGVGEGDAACRAAGEYRVTGPDDHATARRARGQVLALSHSGSLERDPGRRLLQAPLSRIGAAAT